MLRPARFSGDDANLLRRARAFWKDFAGSVAAVARNGDGTLEEIKSRRLITFLDTGGQDLNRAGYIFRDRRDIARGEREVTLKFRHPDRYATQDRNLDAAGAKGARTKFEEDIKAPFVSLYSFSTTVPTGASRGFGSLSDVARLFPDLVDRLPGSLDDARLTAVNGFTARELVVAGASLQLGKARKRAAECALIVWHDHRSRQERPVAVEFSYRYGNKNEKYDGPTSLRAFQVFEVLQTRLARWVDPRSRTKTALVYG
jgi:hypothetical protein